MKIVSTCLRRDLPVYRVTHEGLLANIAHAQPHVIARREDFPAFRNACGDSLHLIDEREVLDDMDLTQLRKMNLEFFPRGAGWYFQQFLKFGFHRLAGDDSHFLIWDADTVPIRPLCFVDAEGRSLFVPAEEYHIPYFLTFEKLFGFPAQREYSFISQHQIIEVAVLRRMLREIESKSSIGRSWPWVIMDSLQGSGSNLFSEYETYGHYFKHHHADRLVLQALPWTRDGGKYAGNHPTYPGVMKISDRFAFAAFEASASFLRRVIRRLRSIPFKFQ